MELLFDEIHWLAYMAHLRSAIDFYQHIMDLANLSSNILPKQLSVHQFVVYLNFFLNFNLKLIFF